METPTSTWPADIIHVNEDGWVLINRGKAHGVAPGLRLFVVGNGFRELRDLFPKGDGKAPVVLRTRRTYELLEVVYTEEQCAVAVAARAPAARRPEFYRGPTGELLVWVPLPDDYTWPPPPGADDEVDDEDEDAVQSVEAHDAAGAEAEALDAESGEGTSAGGHDSASEVDEPPGRGDQQDERWEEALPLNGVSVGDIVIPASPAETTTAKG